MLGMKEQVVDFWKLGWLSPSAVESVSTSALCPDGRFSGALGTGQTVSAVSCFLGLSETGRQGPLPPVQGREVVPQDGASQCVFHGRAAFSFIVSPPLSLVSSLYPPPCLGI